MRAGRIAPVLDGLGFYAYLPFEDSFGHILAVDGGAKFDPVVARRKAGRHEGMHRRGKDEGIALGAGFGSSLIDEKDALTRVGGIEAKAEALDFGRVGGVEGGVGLSLSRDAHDVEHGDGAVGPLVALGAEFEFGGLLEGAVGLVVESDAVVGRGRAGKEGRVDRWQAARGAEKEGSRRGLDRLALREEADQLLSIELHGGIDFRPGQGGASSGHDVEEFLVLHGDDGSPRPDDEGVFAGGKVVLEDHDLERHVISLGRPGEAGFRAGACRHGPRQGGRCRT